MVGWLARRGAGFIQCVPVDIQISTGREGARVSIVETRVSLWEALAGRAPGVPLGPADRGLWIAVAERINPAKARPVLRAGIESAELVSARGVPYTMLR